ncbi:hypothetical protein DERP_008125 [Dermatophagoides pteronyssinus]|uniref:Uncharacterized protein n=1 Tax=Dermatophagoides pteronyssinus TaxID=6956 RepID=A0ABQ8JK91_DERPT|nr:hypothetical protein DERP_008125 [Dermatophagoides pteronyssinus]
MTTYVALSIIATKKSSSETNQIRSASYTIIGYSCDIYTFYIAKNITRNIVGKRKKTGILMISFDELLHNMVVVMVA